MIKLVYKNEDPTSFLIPTECLPPDGIPYTHHFKGRVGDQLIELAGRVCYDSAKNKKTRASEDYHNHINEVKHHSTHEHLTTTVSSPMDYRDLSGAALALLDRPGVSVQVFQNDPADDFYSLRITANLRALRDWDRYSQNIPAIFKSSEDIYTGLYNAFAYDSEYAIQGIRKPNGQDLYDCVVPINDNEIFYTFYIADVSRGLTHELVRHRRDVGISQRSTRYVDEASSDWIKHPMLVKHGSKELLTKFDEYKKLGCQLYDDITVQLRKQLESLGESAFSALKQSRGAARGVLGNALSTELIWTASLREIKEIIKQRGNPAADAEIKESFAYELFQIVQPLQPLYFFDFSSDPVNKTVNYNEPKPF